MKIFRRVFVIIFLLISLAYVTNITGIPESVLLFKGEELSLGEIFGVYVKEKGKQKEEVQAYSSLNDIEVIEKSTVYLSLFNIVNVKEIEVSSIPKTKVIPLGNVVGLKLYASGVLVVGKTEIEGKKPYMNSDISEGDMIIKIGQKQITSTTELIECVNASNGKDLEIVYLRNGEEKKTNIEPVKTTSNEYKLGLWVRDGAVRNWNSDIL